VLKLTDGHLFNRVYDLLTADLASKEMWTAAEVLITVNSFLKLKKHFESVSKDKAAVCGDEVVQLMHRYCEVQLREGLELTRDQVRALLEVNRAFNVEV